MELNAKQNTREAEQVMCKWTEPGRGNASVPQARGDCRRINTSQQGLLQNALCEPVLPAVTLQQGHLGDIALGTLHRAEWHRAATGCATAPSPCPVQPGCGSSPRSCCSSRAARRLDQIGWARFLVTRKTTTSLPSPSQPSHTHICHA